MIPKEVIATLRDNSNGKIVEIEDKNQYSGISQEGCAFIWLEGNYSCDCNRLIFMYPELEEDSYLPCGDLRISLLKLTFDGKLLFEGDDRL